MIKNFTLQPLLNLAQNKTESATRELGKRNHNQALAQEKLDLLQGYRSDYQTRLQAATVNGMDPMALRNFQSFINKLDEAIMQQRKVVEQSKVSVQLGRTEFDSTQRRLKSFTTLQERHIEEQKKLDATSEQRALDEHTGRFVARRMINESENND